MTSVFVNITPEMRESILERIRQTQADVLQQLVDSGLLTAEEASAEAGRLLMSETPYADAQQLFERKRAEIQGEKLQ